MSRTAWSGLPKLPAWPWQRDDADAAPPRDGLVLAGGGSRGSFEIGALLYLYDHTDFHPTAITGTSAGSILGSALAQSADRDEQRRTLLKLEAIWRGLREPSDMFAPRDWYRRILHAAPELGGVFDIDGSDPIPAPTVEERPRAWFGLPVPLRRRPSREELAQETEKEPGPDEHFHPLLGFGPEADELGPGASWNAQAVAHAVSVLQVLGRSTGDIPHILHGAERTRAMYRPGRILRRLLAPDVFDPSRIATSGVDLRVPLVCLETGQLRYLRGDGTLADRSDVPLPDQQPVDMVLGILASCSIPGVFSPVPLGDGHYVDGGVRENLPVEACVGHLGVERPVVIVCAPPGVTPDPGLATANLLSVFARTAAILADECLRDEVAYARSLGCRVIEPEIDVHGPMVVDPGLINLNMAYGWMRAHEVMTDATDAEVRLHREVTMMRQRCWALENDLFGPADLAPAETDAEDDLLELVELKYRIRDAVAARPELFPEDATGWWRGYEGHGYRVAPRPPWLPLEPPTSPGGGGVDAARSDARGWSD